MTRVEWHDVQGLITSGYGTLTYSAYVVWKFRPGQMHAAKTWLRDLAERLMRADGTETMPDGIGALRRPPTHIGALRNASGDDRKAINVALTADGLRALELDGDLLSEFSLEFLEGMAPKPTSTTFTSRRCNILGDAGDSSPDRWEWGGWTGSEVHGVLLLYAPDDAALRRLVSSELLAMGDAAEVVVSANDGGGHPVTLFGRVYDDHKEHFGFVDGISQPTIEGTPALKRDPDAKSRRISVVKPGEFILGYPNERRERIESEVARKNPALPDLLRNGTYLVFRQLEQDVDAFVTFVAQLAREMHGDADPESVEEVAARLIGRYRDGSPLVRRGAHSRDTTDRNDFLYANEDGAGTSCPIGSHIRRANPRDAIGSDPEVALRLSKMHRIMRRGRPYGERRGTEPGGDETSARRGTAFIALNADIAGQFEMIQHSWLNNSQFGGLAIGTDPISHVACPGDEIVIQQRPFNVHVERPRPFVRVKGGAYFFMPGINALRALTRFGDDVDAPVEVAPVKRAFELIDSND